jgi:hypothetical protein
MIRGASVTDRVGLSGRAYRMKSARPLWLGIAACAALSCSLAVAGRPASGQVQAPVECRDFTKLSEEAQKRGTAVGNAIKAKADHKQVCTLMNTFITAESAVVKFLETNKVWCAVPEQVVANAKANHEKSLKFRTVACTEEPKPKVPTLSDAIKAPATDTEKNTRTGRGTFDTLTGNPLAR